MTVKCRKTLQAHYLYTTSGTKFSRKSIIWPIMNVVGAITTNTIEGYHRQIRKVTKNKGVFTSDMALLKLIYLATDRIGQKWTMPLNNWAISATQLKIIFGDRMKTDL